MDKYEKLFDDIRKRTETGSLCWKIVSPSRYADHVFNPQHVYRTFYCNYELSDDISYTLVFVERKDQAVDEYDEEFEKYDVYILVIKDDHLVFTLTSGHVDKKSLFGLAECIEEHSDEAKELFSFFKDDDDL